MKKILLTTLCLVLTSTSFAFAAQKRGSLDKTSNMVQIKSSGGWTKASSGEAIFVGDSIRTGLRSVAEIKYDDGTKTRIGSRSTITVKDREINIKSGYIWGKVDKHKTKGLKVYTASAVASIMGTEFFAEVNRDKSSTITVLEGEIAFSGKEGQKVYVKAGMTSTIDKDGLASEPTPLNKDKVLERFSEVVNF